MKSILLTTFFLFIYSTGLFAQGTIEGILKDSDNGEALIYANMTVYHQDSIVLHATTDIEGKYSVSLPDGIYDIEFSYVGFTTKKLVGITVNQGDKTELDVGMKPGAVLDEVVVVSYRQPIVKYDMAMSTAKVTSDDKKSIRIRGKRKKSSDLYMVDGIKLKESVTAMPSKVVSTVAGSSAGFSSSTPPPSPSTTPGAFAFDAESDESAKKALPDKDGNSPEVKAGLLTAGERNDLDNWNYWEDIIKKDTVGAFQETWQIYPNQRYSVRITNTDGLAIPNCKVTLQDGAERNLWTAITDNYGNAELWANPYTLKEKSDDELFLIGEYNGERVLERKVFDFSRRINKYVIQTKCHKPTNADIMFVVDATGSMCDEINYLKAELKDVINKVTEQDEELNIRLGSLFYRDKSDEYITVSSGLSDDIDKVSEFINNQYCGGGGDYPEAVHTALQEAINRQEWREDAVARIIFLVLDAPPHEDQEVIERLQKDVALAATKGIKIIPVVASGIDKSTEFLMRYFSVLTNGTYVFLTDHSGIGNAHLEPTVDDYDVENLNDLLVRLISKYTIHGGCLNSEQIVSNEEEDPFDISFYPNPSAGYVVVEINDNNTSVVLFDATGKQVFVKKDLPAGRHELNLTNLIHGTYAIRFEHGKEVKNGKLIIVNRV